MATTGKTKRPRPRKRSQMNRETRGRVLMRSGLEGSIPREKIREVVLAVSREANN